MGGLSPFEVIVGHFSISGGNGVQSLPPKESKLVEKTVHHPSVVILGVLQRIDFALRVWDPNRPSGGSLR